MNEPQMLIYAQCGRRHFPADDVTANVAAYKEAFGLPPALQHTGRVPRQFDRTRNPTDSGEPIETALAMPLAGSWRRRPPKEPRTK